ncbi:flagellar hook capping FlgD N-terminal domain-containing protein [Paenalcaligenes niemegkensis]|uniref:flagellar hook capping FlgD N-terminal domain-containing protein n=1 Tax=Paenalcaligenes niemegkensis TaxID=2895469 RepID=UPI003568C985
MSTVNNVTQNPAANAMSLARAQNNDLLGDTQDRFLTLLVTQLQNQDPLNPMDNSQVTSQIAQLSTVNGINDLNNTLLAVAGQIDVSQSMQAAELIGKDVLVPGSKISLGSNPDDPTIKTATAFGIDVISPAAKITVTISDKSGKAVRQIELDPLSEGVYTVDWDGLDDSGNALPDGVYAARVDAFDGDGQSIYAEALTSGRVSSVAYSSKGLQLDLGLAGNYSLLDIRKIM